MKKKIVKRALSFVGALLMIMLTVVGALLTVSADMSWYTYSFDTMSGYVEYPIFFEEVAGVCLIEEEMQLGTFSKNVLDNSSFYLKFDGSIGISENTLESYRSGSSSFDHGDSPSFVGAYCRITSQSIICDFSMKEVYIYTVTATDSVIVASDLPDEGAVMYLAISDHVRSSFAEGDCILIPIFEQSDGSYKMSGQVYLKGPYDIVYGEENGEYGFVDMSPNDSSPFIELWGWQEYDYSYYGTNASARGSFSVNPNPAFYHILQAEVRTAPIAFYKAVINQGYYSGYEEGMEVGYSTGYYYGHQEGYDEGYPDGFGYGYDKGCAVGFDEGYINGQISGYDAGYVEGKGDGIELGRTEALNDTSTFKDMVFAIFDAPGRLIDGMLDFDFLGINLAGFVKTLLTLLVAAVIVVALIKIVF